MESRRNGDVTVKTRGNDDVRAEKRGRNDDVRAEKRERNDDVTVEKRGKICNMAGCKAEKCHLEAELEKSVRRNNDLENQLSHRNRILVN